MNHIKLINYTKNNNSHDDNIIVNYSCYCGKYFKNIEKLLYILPCCHIVHENCFNKYLIQLQYTKFKKNENLLLNINDFDLICPQCNNKIKTILNEKKIFSKSKYNKYSIDLKSVKLDNSASINYLLLPIKLLNFTSILNKVVLSKTQVDIIECIEYVFKAFNIKINIIDNTKKNPISFKNKKIEWIDQKINNSNIVIISNHVHNFDPVIFYYLFKCGFVASDFINTTDIGRLMVEKMDLLVFKRGIDTNMVEKIKAYLHKMKRIMLFPEGSMGNHETLLRFRTGAFYTDAIICPVVIKYDPFVYDDDFKQMAFKMITQPVINVNVYINDLYFPPFNNDKIELVRNKIATIGGFNKSRVSNKSVKE